MSEDAIDSLRALLTNSSDVSCLPDQLSWTVRLGLARVLTIRGNLAQAAAAASITKAAARPKLRIVILLTPRRTSRPLRACTVDPRSLSPRLR